MSSAVVATLPMPAVQPACPVWCSHHTTGALGGPDVHSIRLGPIGGLRLDLWRSAADGPMHASLLDADGGELVDIIDPAALRPLAEMFGLASVIVANESGRHRRV